MKANTLKNQGYHLKHNFGHGDQHLSEAFFRRSSCTRSSNLVDGLYQQVTVPAARSGTR